MQVQSEYRNMGTRSDMLTFTNNNGVHAGQGNPVYCTFHWVKQMSLRIMGNTTYTCSRRHYLIKC